LIDAILSILFLLMLLSNLIFLFHIYKVYEFDRKITDITNAALLISNDDIAKKNERNEGEICIIRFTDKKERFCYEIT